MLSNTASNAARCASRIATRTQRLVFCFIEAVIPYQIYVPVDKRSFTSDPNRCLDDDRLFACHPQEINLTTPLS